MSISAPGSAGSAGVGEPPSCAPADSEGGDAGSEVRMNNIAYPAPAYWVAYAGVGGLVGWLALPLS